MIDQKFEGKTRAEWLTFRGKGGIGCPHPAETERALLWFDEQDKQAEVEREERRFRIQIDESRRQSLAALIVSVVAILLAIASFVYTVYHDSHSPASTPQSHTTP